MTKGGQENRILIIGLGSIGQRHLRNLHHLGYRELYAVSSGKGTMSTSGLPLKGVVPSLEEGLDQFRPNVVFICHPTSLHMQAALASARAGAHIFMEKPVAVDRQGVDELRSLLMDNDLKMAVGFQYRQHPVLQSIRNLISNGKLGEIHTVRMHWGEYLPGWHPWEDYRKSYSALDGLGGGVTFTLCHPLDYLRWMLGEPVAVQASIKHTTALGIDVDDLHDSTWEFENGTSASVHLNYLERPASHKMTVIGSNGKIQWDNEDGSASLYDEGKLAIRIGVDEGFDRNHLFIAEVREFMDAVASGIDGFCNLADGIVNLEMILASKLSSKEGRTVPMSEMKISATFE